jgi:hypothetical protein
MPWLHRMVRAAASCIIPNSERMATAKWQSRRQSISRYVRNWMQGSGLRCARSAGRVSPAPQSNPHSPHGAGAGSEFCGSAYLLGITGKRTGVGS